MSRTSHLPSVPAEDSYRSSNDALAQNSKLQTALHYFRGRLPPRARRRVQDYITAHLGQTITNDALAEVAGLSVCHFARVFKQTEGYVAAPLRAALSSEASKGAFGRQQNVTVADCFCCGLFRSEPLHPLALPPAATGG
jgi:hypothetical protein